MNRNRIRGMTVLLIVGFLILGYGQACSDFQVSGKSGMINGYSAGGIPVAWKAGKETQIVQRGGYRVYFASERDFNIANFAQHPMVEVSGDVTTANLPITATGKWKAVVQGFIEKPDGTVALSEVSEIATLDFTSSPRQVLSQALSTKPSAAASFKESRMAALREKPSADTVDQRVDQLLSSKGYKTEEILVLYKSGETEKIALRSGEDMREALRTWLLKPDVQSAQPNYLYKANALPNDASMGRLWGLRNSGQVLAFTENRSDLRPQGNPGTPGIDISAEAAWGVHSDCSNITVAVVDTGIGYDHDDLKANMWNGNGTFGKSFVDAAEPDPYDDNGHGTHVAGTIGAVGNNGIGVSGVCQRAKLMAVKVLDSAGSGTSDVISAGIRFAADQGARVINYSIERTGFDSVIDSALQYALSKDVLVVVAAGNKAMNNDDPTNFSYPCASELSNVLCVGAYDQAGSYASFSSYGANTVDVAAPGVNIFSLWPFREAYFAVPLTGWTALNTPSLWGQGLSLSILGVPKTVLGFPANFNGTNQYLNSVNGNAVVIQIPKAPGFGTVDAAYIDFSFIRDLKTNDSVLFRVREGNANPFAMGLASTDPSVLFSGRVDGTTAAGQEDFFSISHKGTCFTSSCYFGLQATTNASQTGFGLGLYDVASAQYEFITNQYAVHSGTSMATPHATGVAALVASLNPSYTSAEIKAAVEKSGRPRTSLIGKTKTGKSVDAYGAVTYVAPVTGLKFP